MNDFNPEKESVPGVLFGERTEPDWFYPGAGREEVATGLEEFTVSEDYIALLTGEEGSGKSLLCRIFAQRAEALGTVVFFPETVESFDDVVRQIALKIGLAEAATFDQIVENLVMGGEPIIVVFDNAEQLYLANLERIRKLLDSVVTGGGVMHVVFAGRWEVLENFDQLSICNFSVSSEQHFELKPLTEGETQDYLVFLAENQGSDELQGRIGGAVFKKIFSLARGNFKVTDEIAVKFLDGMDVESSFMTLLETMQDEIEEDPVHKGGMQRLAKEWWCQYQRYWPWLSAVLCAGIVVVFLLGGDGTKQDMTPPAKTARPVPVKIAQVTEQGSAKKAADISKAQSRRDKEPVSRTQPIEKGTKKIEVVAQQPVVEQPPLTQVQERAVQQEKVAGVANSAAVGEGSELQPIIKAQKIEISVPAEKVTKPAVIKIMADRTMKIHHKLPAQTIQPLKRRPKTEVQMAIASNAQFTTEQLFNTRTGAGADWLAGKKNNRYTVQLMVLKAKGAENNLKKMLAQRRYRQEAGNFYIFKKKAASETIFVFYGEYQNMATARLAQRSIPGFLQAHKPYAISVKAAVSKIRK